MIRHVHCVEEKDSMQQTRKSRTPFDAEHQLRRTRACQEFLNDFLLKYLKNMGSKLDALDVACGVGLLSGTLLDVGFSVTGVDARHENTTESAKRFPNGKFHVLDVESESLTEKLGKFPLVLCFGLFYHLENPLRLMRDLFEITDDFLIIESMIAPGDDPALILMNEPKGNDMSLNGIAFVPTESCLVKMCYQAGFREIFKPIHLPDNDNFRSTLFRRKHRTILVATKRQGMSIEDYNLEAVPESYIKRPDLWTRVPGHIRAQAVKRMPRPVLNIIKRIRDSLTLRR